METTLSIERHFIALSGDSLPNEMFAFPLVSVAVGRIQGVNPRVEAIAYRCQTVLIIDAQSGDSRDGPAPQRNGRVTNVGVSQRSQCHRWLGDNHPSVNSNPQSDRWQGLVYIDQKDEGAITVRELEGPVKVFGSGHPDA